MQDPLRTTTAKYKNRMLDRKELESSIKLQEYGNEEQEFYIPNGPLFAKGYIRIVYGDHGPYIEFTKEQIKIDLESKYGNDISNLPDLDYKYYYFWLNPINYPYIKVYLQIKPVTDLPNASPREDGKPSRFNRSEGYADYKRGFYYINPYELQVKNETI